MSRLYKGQLIKIKIMMSTCIVNTSLYISSLYIIFEATTKMGKEITKQWNNHMIC